MPETGGIPRAQLVAAKISDPGFEKLRKFCRNIKGFSQSGMCDSQSSRSARHSRVRARLPRRSENGPEIPDFAPFASVSGTPAFPVVERGNRRKSPALSAIIPVWADYRRDWLITHAARGRD